MTSWRSTAICGAASPAPFTARMVSNMSDTNKWISSVSKWVTGCATRRRRGSPIFRISLTVITAAFGMSKHNARPRAACYPAAPTERGRNGMQTRRKMAAWLGLGTLAGVLPAWAQAPAKKHGAAPWRFVVNEAVTGETNFFLLTNRYRPLADYLTSHLKGQSIEIEPVVDIQRFLAVAKATPRPELIFGKSVNQLAKLVRDQGYQPLVLRADPYKAAFIVGKDSPIKT